MRILFSAVGSTDPATGNHDGPIMHILRNYKPVDKVYMFLTDEMQKHEDKWQCYSEGVKRVAPNCDIKPINSGIEDPSDYNMLDRIRTEFIAAFNDPDNEGSEWLLNITSGTQQITTIMSLLALDYYPYAKAIQVTTPNRRANKERTREEIFEHLDHNKDDEPNAEKRNKEPLLRPFKEYGLKRQIISLINKYEYRGAYDLVERNIDLFSDTTRLLLQYAVLRKDLNGKEANNILSNIDIDNKFKEQLKCKNDFSEYFQVMELCQRNQQLSDFVVKLSPVLMDLGCDYLSYYLRENTEFRLEDICDNELDSSRYIVSIQKMEQNYPSLFQYVKRKLKARLRDGDLYFHLIVHICDYYKENELNDDEKHKKVCGYFNDLRRVEANVRNDVAHNLTNVTEMKLRKKTDKDSEQILNALHDLIKLVRDNDIECSYDILNKLIENSIQ